MMIEYPENYVSVRNIRQSVSACSEEIENLSKNYGGGCPQEEADFQSRRKLLEIKRHLAQAHEFYLKSQYQKAIEEYKLAQGTIYRLLDPSVPEEICCRPEVQFPVHNDMFYPLLTASLEYVEAIAPRKLKAIFGPAMEVPETFTQYKNLGVHVADAFDRSVRIDGEMGISYANRGQWERAEFFFIRALKRIDYSDDYPEGNLGRAAIMLSLAAVYINMGRLDRALNFLEEAVKIYRENNDMVGEAQYFFNMAALCTKKGNTGSASELLEQGNELIKKAQGLDSKSVQPPAMSEIQCGSIQPSDLSDLYQSNGLAVTYRLPGKGGGWTKQAVEVKAKSSEKDYPKKLRFFWAGKEIEVLWESGDRLPVDQFVNDFYDPRTSYESLSDLRFPDELPSDFAVQIPHVYFYVIPVALGDCYNALGEFETAESYYLEAADYEYINSNLESPALWLKLAENVLEMGDQYYKNDEYQSALDIYRKVMEPPGTTPVVWPESPLYKHPALKSVGQKVEEMLKDFDASGAGDLNPTLAIIVLTVRKRLTQLQAGLDFLGLSSDIVPIWSFEYLQNAARYFAQQAVQAEREFINFLDRGENEEFSRQQLNQAANIANAEYGLAVKQREAAEAELDVCKAGQTLATSRRNNAQQNYNDYNSMSWERIWLSRDNAWFSSENPWELTSPIGGNGPNAGRHLHEVIADKTERLQTITRDYELASMKRQIEELKNAEVVAQAQVKAANAQVNVGWYNQYISNLREQAAKDNIKAFDNQLFTPEVWKRMGIFMRNISNNYFDMALRVAKMMQRAYNFENDVNRQMIKADYSAQTVKGMLAGEALLLDIDSFTYDQIVTIKRKQIPVKQTISLVERYPFLFETQLRQTGRMQFETRLEDFDLAFPGTYGRRIENVEVEIEGILPRSGIRGTLTNNGISRYRTQDINQIKFRIQPKETLLLSEYRLKEDAFVFPTDTRKLKIFEGAGVESTWTLEIPKATNDLDFYSITDIRITFYYNAFYDQTLEGAVKEQLASFTGATVRQKSIPLRWAYPDVFFHFQDTGKLAFSLDSIDFPFNEQNPQIRKLAMMLITEPGMNPSNWKIRFGVPGHAEPVAASPNEKGEIVAASGHPWEPLVTGKAIGDYLIEIRAEENPDLVENGVLKLNKIRNIIFILEYEYKPRT
ncbi:hypothetical protein CN326_09720 [Bacillus sp. AFS018417]|uniref:Tc toxin subunit A-related protein n=1 Tax=Bacillus sp. AFS018417 TaxID=2033491 RepID=UPI000BFA7ECF|nr:tetratricopeptide repeat protein [Bacillus sp. AFS018417]PEZ06746.1 hypothetical protein CN326_09720 [Bacillus sp. AFS018417]